MDANVMEKVGSNMKQLRKKFNLSQDDIALKMHIARPVISNWELGKSEPSTSQLARLAQILSISLDALVNDESDGEKVVVVDTSMLIKRPAIIEELVEKFDEVIIPQVVIEELNNLKGNGKPWLKRQAALLMNNIDTIKSKNKKCIVQPSLPHKSNDINDEQIANIAIERAKNNFCDKVYVFARDIYFSYLVKEKRNNLIPLPYSEYRRIFFDNGSDYNEKKAQEFITLLKNKEWEQIKQMEYDPEIDINYVDPESGYTPLIQAIKHKNIDIIRHLMEKYKTHIELDLHDNYKYKFTPLLHTAQMMNLEIMQLLVEEGADIDTGSRGDNDGNTPLMVCAWHGFYEGVKFLVERGACLNQQDGKNGYTALMKACIKGHLEIAALLIKGTDVNIRSRREYKKAIEFINHNKKNSSELCNLFKGRI